MTPTTLYYSPGTASFVVHWLLIELAVPHQLVHIDFDKREQKSADYLRLNPAGVVPTLVLNGQPIGEAAAIVMHLGDLHPQAKLAPPTGTAARASYYQWMFFMANTLQPAFRAWYYPDEPAGEANIAATKTQAEAQIEVAWHRVADQLAKNGPYLLGENLSAADFLLTMLMRWSRNLPLPADTHESLATHARLMKARPSFKELYAREALTDWT